MNEQLRDAIGKAAYTAWKGDTDQCMTWEELPDVTKEKWMKTGEAAVLAFNDWMYEYVKRQMLP